MRQVVVFDVRRGIRRAAGQEVANGVLLEQPAPGAEAPVFADDLVANGAIEIGQRIAELESLPVAPHSEQYIVYHIFRQITRPEMPERKGAET